MKLNYQTFQIQTQYSFIGLNDELSGMLVVTKSLRRVFFSGQTFSNTRAKRNTKRYQPLVLIACKRSFPLKKQ